MAGTFSIAADTPLWELVTFLDSSHFDRHSSFLDLLTLYNYSKLVSSILHMTTPEIFEMVTISFIRLFFSHPIPRSGIWHGFSFYHCPPASSASAHLSMPLLKLQAQHSTPDLTCLCQHIVVRPIISLKEDTRIFKTL